MILAGLLFVVFAGLAVYYVRLHLVWRAEVRRRKLEREREREQSGYGRMYALIPDPGGLELRTPDEIGYGAGP